MREIHDATSTGKVHCAILGSPVRCVLLSTAIVSGEPFFCLPHLRSMARRKLRFFQKVQIC